MKDKKPMKNRPGDKGRGTVGMPRGKMGGGSRSGGRVFAPGGGTAGKPRKK